MGDVLLTDFERGVGLLVAEALDRLGIDATTSRGPAPAGQAAAAEVWLGELESSAARALVVNHCRLREGGLSRRSLEMAESVLAAAARCATLERVVVLSSGQVYGAGFELPTFVPEEQPPVTRPGPSAEDLSDLEAAAAAFAAVRPDVVLTILRPAEVLGATPHGLLADHLLAAGGFVTAKLGYDPQVQFVTPHGVAAAVVHALTEDVPGIYNIGPADAVPLSAAISLVGRVRVPMVRTVTRLGGILGRMDPWSHELGVLMQYGRALDAQRACDAGFPRTVVGRGRDSGGNILISEQEAGSDMTQVPEVDIEEAVAELASGAFLLDVREDSEVAAGRAPGSVHIALGALPDGIDDVPDDRRVLVICRSGNRSARAAEYLNRQGFDAVNVAGGMRAWDQAGEAVEDAGGAPGTVI